MGEAGQTVQSSDIVHDAGPLQVIDLVVPFAQPAPEKRQVEGRIVFDYGAPAEGLTLRLYCLGFGGAEGAKRLAETTTGEHGVYNLPYTADNQSANLEVRSADAAGNEVALSGIIKNAGEREVMNLVAPGETRPLAAEFERLTSDLQPHVGEMSRLGAARENSEQPDLTLLHEATGWDARLIATAAMATSLSAAEETGLPHDALYGLLRLGLPSDKLHLAQVSTGAFDQALDKARASGIVSISDEQAAQTKLNFDTFRVSTRLAVQAPGSHATYGDLLQKLNLGEAAQQSFAKLYLDHRGDADSLWAKAAQAGLGDVVPALQKQGKLAFLTTNDPELTAKLQSDIGAGGPEQLVKMGLYKKEKWLDLIGTVPHAFGDAADPAGAYADDMARKVRISFATEVAWDMIETGEFTLEGGNANLSALLKNAIGKGFKLGGVPIDAFLNANPEVFDGISETDRATAKEMLKTLQRVYQITPGNDALKTLLNEGLLSAQDVLAYPLDVFLERFVSDSLTEEQARLVYRKAEQVSNITYSLMSLAKELNNAPPVPAMSAPDAGRQAAKEKLAGFFPTMETLFGSLDFCECQDCRSVLSPAAYLVDLLQFLDRDPKLWENTLKDWEQKHGAAPYPFRNNEDFQAFLAKWHSRHPGEPDPDTKGTPYEILIGRRPDLPHVALTCENTNTALPQIDLVNEILEYYVANNALKADAAHDTGEATTAELLAEPQYVISEAYTALQQARYPLELPFDLWIETARQFAAYFEVPLWRLLESFRRRDELFAPAEGCDRAAIFFETLGLSPAEVAIFTNPDPLPNWFELYGFAAQAEALTEAVDADTRQRIDLNSAKALSRRLGVTYREMVEIVRSGFVNPGLADLALLYKMGVKIEDAHLYRDGRQLYDENKDLAGKKRGDLSPADQKRFDDLAKQVPDTQLTGWELVGEVAAFEQRLNEKAAAFNRPAGELQAHIQSIAFEKILVLADNDAGCNFDKTALRYADGGKADPIALLKINLFVRLWRKLGWSMEETDHALSTFIAQSAPFDDNPAHLAKQPLKAALIYLAHLKVLDQKVKLGKQSRLRLLSLWSDLATTGANPLYAQLFLSYGIRRSAAVDIVVDGEPRSLSVFDDPLGRYLLPAQLAKISEQVRYEARLPEVKDSDQINAAPFAGEPRLTLRYDPLAEVQYLSCLGVLSDPEKTRLAALAPSEGLSELLDLVQTQAGEFRLVKGHLPALQGALGLTLGEIGCILGDAGNSLDSAELSLANVSLLYRYGMLAKALKLPVAELIALKQLSGLDPFLPLHPDPLATIEEDHPFSQTLRFCELVDELRDAGLKTEDLDYLLRHRFDETGSYRQNREGLLVLLKSLSDGIVAIRAEYAVPSDPGALSDEVLRQKLGLALPPAVVDLFLSLMNATAEFRATKTVTVADRLQAADFAGDPAISRLAYDETKQEQTLVCRGMLFDAQKAQLQAKYAAKLTAGQHAAFSDLLDAVQALATQQAQEFFVKHLEKQTINTTVTAGFLETAEFELLFEPLPEIGADLTESERMAATKANEEKRQKRLAVLARAFFLFLQQRLIRQFIVQTLAGYAAADPALVETLLTDARLLKGPGSEPLLDLLQACGLRGVSAAFFDSADLSGAPQAVASVVSSAETALKDARDRLDNPLNPANSAHFEGYLEVPATGAYRFSIELEKEQAEAALRFGHLPQPLFLSGVAAAGNAVIGDQPDEFLELQAGIPYSFSLDLRKLNGGAARLVVQGETLPKDSLSKLTLYPLSSLDGAANSIVLLTKVLQLVETLGLGESEITYLLTHAADFGGVDLSRLPTRTVGDTPAEKAATTTQFPPLLRLAAYARAKREVAGGTDDLIGIFQANETGDLDAVYALIARLTRRDATTVKMTAKARFPIPAFKSGEPLLKLWDTLQVVERFAVPVTSLVEWLRIASPAATSGERFQSACHLKEAVKARFEPEAWLRVAQPIFDKLRQRQRDALVAHVMHRHGFDRMEQLFEFFLIDPGAEPVLQTSRIRAAVSALQIFVHRCLLNLEPGVAPAAINSKQWQWMKRYSVWAGNRKLWLFPENVLEPEFRDDKTHLFTELEGKLLQGDVSNDLAEDAFFGYLKKLDELARLDIVAMYCEEQALDPASNLLHVIGRTYGEPHKYFYRRYQHQMWTPWEPVPVEIEGDHIVPVIWRDRLNLFWVTFIDNPDPEAFPSDDNFGDLIVKGSLKDFSANQKIALASKNEAPLAVGSASAKPAPKSMAEMSLGQLAGGMRSAVNRKLVKVLLHWSEYLQGEWSVRESGGFGASLTTSVPLDFDSAAVFIHATKEYDEGEERAVKIHLGGQINKAFKVVSRNCRPTSAAREPAPLMPYNAPGVQANRHAGEGAFKVTFAQRIETEDGKPAKTAQATPSILKNGDQFTLLACANALTIGTDEIVSLVSPLFYQDELSNTFYIEPNFKEKTIEEWQEWVTRTPEPEVEWDHPEWWDNLPLEAMVPKQKAPVPVNPGDPIWQTQIDPRARFSLASKEDWLANPATLVPFQGELIGPAGQAGLAVRSALETGSPLEAAIVVNAGSAIEPGSTVVAVDNNALASSGLARTAGGLNVVGGNGLNSALLKNVKAIKGL